MSIVSLKRPSTSPLPPLKLRRIMPVQVQIKVIDIPFTKYYQRPRLSQRQLSRSPSFYIPSTSTPTPIPSSSSSPKPRSNLKPKRIHGQPQSQLQRRQTSPLSPGTPSLLPARPTFPKSKPKPDLLRAAIKACMKQTPQGRSLLKNGPRKAAQFLASSPQHQVNAVIDATRDLERIIDDMVMRTLESDDGSWDVDMDGEIPGLTAAAAASLHKNDTPAPPHLTLTTTAGSLTKSWVDISNEPDTDWEMIYG